MYYLFDRFGPRRWLDHAEDPYFEDADFDLGERIGEEVPESLEFTLHPLDSNSSDDGPDMPEFLTGPIPVFRDDLVKAMHEAGVDNLDLYDAVVIDPDTDERHSNYKAVNIIGLISAADMEQSEATVHTGGPVIDVDFDSLVVDESRAGGALIFRLAESTNAILVHEKLKNHLLEAGFDKLEFLDLTKSAI